MSKVILGNVPRRTKPNRTVQSPTSANPGVLGDTAENFHNTSNDFTFNFPPSLAVGDVMILAVHSTLGSVGHNTPSGWTLLSNNTYDGDRFSTYYKVATLADVTAGSGSFTRTGSPGSGYWYTTKVSPGDGIDFSTVPPEVAATTTHSWDPPLIAPSAAPNDYVVFAMVGTNRVPTANPSGYTEHGGTFDVDKENSGDAGVYPTYKNVSITTNEDPSTFTGGGTGQRTLAVTIAVRRSGSATLATGDHTHTESDITNLGHWTETDHDLLDHTGLTGVGGAHTHEGAALSFDAAEALSPSDTNHYGFPGYAIVGDVHVATYRQGASHVSTDGVIKQVRSTDGGVTWGAATTVYSNASYDAREAILTKLSDGRLVMAVGVQSSADGSGVADGGFILISSDSGATWGTAKQIDDGGATDWSLVSGQVLELENGDWITAITVKDTGVSRVIRIIKTADDGDTWTVANSAAVSADDHDAALNEAGLVRQGSTIVMIFRDNVGSGFGYRQWRKVSTDGGVTWTTATQVLDGYGGSPRLLYRENGQIVVILRDSPSTTYPPVVLSSDDLGLTWSEELNFTGDYFAYGQPAEDDSGVVHAVYSIESASQADAVVYYRAGVDPGAGDLLSHADLPGLLEDDHTQYSRVDGSRAFTGTVSGVTPTADAHLATKAYVDSGSGGRWEVVVSGTAPPVAVTNEAEDDWVYAWVED